MDKETLSNYGWIVICVLVLAVMIALATPFGEFIKDAVWNTTNGLFDVNENALQAAGINTTQPQKNTVTGSYITLDNVSSTPHTLGVTLSSDTVTDFSSVSVTRYGNNILDISKMLNSDLVDNGDGTFTFTHNRVSQAQTAAVGVNVPANVPFDISVKPIENTFSDGRMAVKFFFADGTTESVAFVSNTQVLNTYCVYDKDIVQVQFSSVYQKSQVGEYIIFSEPKINIGSSQPYTEYETPQTVIANADGTVTGLTSVSPYLTILTDNPDVEITCEYQKKN